MGFNKPNLEALQKLASEAEKRQQEQADREGGDLRWVNMEMGSNIFLLMPPYNEAGMYVKMGFTHWNLGDNGDEKCTCIEKTHPHLGFECPICFAISTLLANGTDQQDIKPNSARPRTYINVIPQEIGGKELDDDTPWLSHILAGPAGMGNYILAAFNNKHLGDFANPEATLPLQVRKTKTGPKKWDVEYDYGFLPGAQAIVGEDDDEQEIADSIYDLDKIIGGKWTSDRWGEAVMLANKIFVECGFAELEDEDFPVGPKDEEKEEKPKPKKAKANRRRSAKKKPAAEDD